MPIPFKCDNCSRVYELPDAAAGKQAKCECGEMLTVPTPPTQPPETAPPKRDKPPEKPPRTLAKAVEQSQKKKAPDFDGAAFSALADERRRQRDEPVPTEVPPLPPPPLPPRMAPPPADPTPAIAKRYLNLRAYCTFLSFSAVLFAIVAALLVVGEISVLLTLLQGLPHDPATMLRVGLAPTCAIVVTFGVGVLGYVFQRALAEFFKVLMDIEENTRR
ncbi:hypothetical protein Pla108_22880 [Botrimarina colliarenosi]|uniref:DUF4282 domain-containing protein n=1 Tax=Botrimarina colliarenosi TaxID=2528001 RepID=A0A5C6AGF0_9BACT|nr:hypothetical protein [Botrimarina colliarenosi]TWT98131.1 hypothetical protein Pla108_22880 [Botrimarina colliarenosi]